MFSTKPHSFAWITDEDYRGVVARDFEEAEICFTHRANNACQVMLGSVMEGLLSYGLSRKRVSFPEYSTLEKLISLARENGLLPPGEASFGQGIRDFRNMVHPAKEILHQQMPTRESAELARNACQYLVSELERRLQGYLPTKIEASLVFGEMNIPVHFTPFLIARRPHETQPGHHVSRDELLLDCPNLSTKKGEREGHARIILNQGVFYLEDLQSTNGTYLMKGSAAEKLRPRKPKALFSGTRFRLGRGAGDPQLTFLLEGEGPTVVQQ